MSDKTIVVLTGAGISAESGLSTFRDNDGLWCNHRVEDVATPEAYLRNPALVYEFYNQRREQLKEVEPNPAHYALAELAEKWDGKVWIVTQNVDDLHSRALASHTTERATLIPMHGELKKARCDRTDQVVDWQGDMTVKSLCDCCQKAGSMRPHIVWFGEMPLQMELIYKALQECDLFFIDRHIGECLPSGWLRTRSA